MHSWWSLVVDALRCGWLCMKSRPACFVRDVNCSCQLTTISTVVNSICSIWLWIKMLFTIQRLVTLTTWTFLWLIFDYSVSNRSASDPENMEGFRASPDPFRTYPVHGEISRGTSPPPWFIAEPHTPRVPNDFQVSIMFIPLSLHTSPMNSALYLLSQNGG